MTEGALGGAEAPSRETKGTEVVPVSLREQIQLILSKNLVQVLSLKGVGAQLLQCMKTCCKPWPMAVDEYESSMTSPSTARTGSSVPALDTWSESMLLALEQMNGAEAQSDTKILRGSVVKKSVQQQLERFDMWDVEVAPKNFDSFFASKGVDYSGEEVKLAQRIKWKAIENSFPQGVGELPLENFCVKGTLHYVQNFEDYMIPEEDRIVLKPPTVMVDPQEWESVCRGLVAKGLCEVWPVDQLYHSHGQPVLNGLFAVGKGEWEGQLETQRLIMNLTPVNELCGNLQGDMGTLPMLTGLNALVMGEDCQLLGTASDQILQLRQTYEVMKLPRHEKKGVQRALRAEVQGALVLGDLGVAIPKPGKVLQYVGLTIELLRRGSCTLRELQVVCGGLVYLTSFRKPLLSCLNQVWVSMETLKVELPVVRKRLPDAVVSELVRFLCLVPCAQMFFGCKVSPVVTCSDASQAGGGMCASAGLTPYGVRAALVPVRGDVPEPHDWCQVLSVGLFDGIGALRVACDVLQLPMAGHISIENNPEAKRVVEAYFPDSQFHDDVRTVDKKLVQQYALRYSNVGVVVVGAGPPCQGVSQLNFDRRGALRDHRSCLFSEVPRVTDLFRECFPWAQVHQLMENVASMSEEDCQVMSEAVETSPWQIDSLGLSACRRPRLYWVSWELLGQEGVVIDPPETANVGTRGCVRFDKVLEYSEVLLQGWVMAGDNLPTFTTARPSSTPGRKPAGMAQCNQQELERWRQDRHRFPPYQYRQSAGLVNKRGEWRLPSVEEREACMGLPVGYTKMCVPKGQQVGTAFEDKRMSLIGNSWQVTVVAWLLQSLFVSLGLVQLVPLRDLVKRVTPGCGSSLQAVLLRPPLNHARGVTPQSSPPLLVPRLLGIASVKGEDLLLQSSTELSVKFHRLRASIPSKLWKWREIAGTLKSLTVQPKTRQRYEKARNLFYEFLHRESITLPRKRDALDPLLAEYIEHLWSSGEGRGLASDTVASLQDLDPKLKGHLALTWRLLKTWHVNEVPNRAPPVPEAAIHAMIGWSFFHEEYLFGLSLMVGFFGLLRTGELFDLRASSIYMTGPSQGAVLALGLTKAGKRAGAAESVTIHVQEVLKKLWEWKQSAKPQDPLVTSPSRWRKLFATCTEELHLASFNFRPYSLRRGLMALLCLLCSGAAFRPLLTNWRMVPLEGGNHGEFIAGKGFWLRPLTDPLMP
eukprot:Skav220832  [mRNA]  locus=scaffold1888:98162:103688:+ [translate_table: standard]